MIEFKGEYYHPYKTKPSQSVLVQFDGTLLHIWHMSNPFHRILSSDVFQIKKGTRSIKLLNGGKIETDDMNAVVLLHAKCKQLPTRKKQWNFAQRHIIIWIVGILAVLVSTLAANWLSNI